MTIAFCASGFACQREGAAIFADSGSLRRRSATTRGIHKLRRQRFGWSWQPKTGTVRRIVSGLAFSVAKKAPQKEFK